MISILLPLALWAQASLLQPFPSTVKRNEVFSFTPIANHHFSLEAPQSCGSATRLEHDARVVKCQFSQAQSTKVTLNICDDKKTYCKSQTVDVSVLNSQGQVSPMLAKNQDLNHELKHTLIPDFHLGSPEEILPKAAKERKPVFVMVSTDWCPPCNEAKEHLLNTAGFKSASRDWFKLYIDGDSLISAQWEKYVHYRYFPSFILYNAKFEEVARFTNALRQKEFVEWAAKASAEVQEPISKLQAKVQARLDGSFIQRLSDLWSRIGPEQRLSDQARMLKWALDQDDRAWIERLRVNGNYPELNADLLRFQLTELENPKKSKGEDDRPRHIELYHRLLEETMAKDGWSMTLEQFCSYDSKACVNELAKVEARLVQVAQRSNLSAAEKASLLGEEYFGLVRVYSVLGRAPDEKRAAQNCVKAFSELSQQSVLKISRSAQQGMVTCLEKEGQYKQVQSKLKELIAAYPAEPTFLMRMARTLRKAKRPAEALVWIEKAEAVAYGYNWIQIQSLKAEVLIDLKRNPEASSVLQMAIQQIPVDANADSRNQAMLARFRQLQAKVGFTQSQ